jgi:hypothetical protein
VDAVPEEQRLVVGAEAKDWPFEDPQEPLIGVVGGVVDAVLTWHIFTKPTSGSLP